MQRILLIFAFALLITTALQAGARKWTSSDGKYTLEAELVESDDTSVTLKRKSGETVSVPLDRLSEADHRYLTSLKNAPANKKEKPGPAKAVPAKKESKISYTRDVLPFLQQYCGECHNKEKSTAGYNVTSYETLLKRGQYGSLVVPGNSDISRVCEVMQGMSKSMPPGGSAQPPREEIAKIFEWVEAGALNDAQAPTGAKGRASAHKKGAR